MASGVNGNACPEAASITWEVMVTSHDGLGDETGILQQLAARRVVVLDVSVGKRYKYSLLSENR